MLHRASTRPQIPPARASIRLSVRSCCSTRLRLAPNARRNANSRCRTAPRTRSRLPTFTQAMSRIRLTTTVRKVADDLGPSPAADIGNAANLVGDDPGSRLRCRAEFLRHLRVDDVELGRCHRGIDAVVQPAKKHHTRTRAVLHRRNHPGPRADWNPDVGSERREDPVELARRDSHHGVRLRLGADGSAQDVGTQIEMPLPDGVADDGDRIRVAGEPSSQCGSRADDARVVARHRLRRDEGAVAIDVQVGLGRKRGCESGQCAASIAEIPIGRIRECGRPVRG